MSFITVGRENSPPVEARPLNGDAWEKQTAAVATAGHRVITYDRRSFGPQQARGRMQRRHLRGHLDAVLRTLDPAFRSSGMGTGEITRYVGKYGTNPLRKAVLIAGLGPIWSRRPRRR